jgi:type II secretory pathway pseudopilin PulG
MSQANERQGGFTILGLLVVLIIIGILATAIGIPALSTSFNKKRAGVTIREVLSIVDAASNYLSEEGEWPDQDNDCADFIPTLEGDNYIAGINQSPWSTPYTITCDSDDPKTIAISVAADNKRWARYIARGLPAGQVGGAGNRVAAAIVPRSLVLQGSSPDALRDAQVATNATFYQGQVYGIPDNRIDKPDCPTGYDPRVYAAFSGFSDSSTPSPIGAAYIEVTSQNANYWYLRGSVQTRDGTFFPNRDRVQMMALTRCEKDS